MSTGSQDQPETEVRRPRGWVLCAVYVLVTSPLVTSIVLAVAQLTSTLAAKGMIDAENDILAGSSMVLQVVLACGILLLVFQVLRVHYRVRPLVPEEEHVVLAPAFWSLIAVMLCMGLLIVAKHLGFYTFDRLDWLVAVLAYSTFGHWPLRCFHDPLVGPPPGPKEATVRDC